MSGLDECRPQAVLVLCSSDINHQTAICEEPDQFKVIEMLCDSKFEMPTSSLSASRVFLVS